MVVGFNYSLLMILAVAGLGAPLGMPPGEADPALDRLQPAQVLASFNWNGMATPDGKSDNATEQLLADPEIQQLWREVAKTIDRVTNSNDAPPQIAAQMQAVRQLSGLLLPQPGCLFLERLDPAQGPNGIHGALVIRLGAQADQVKATLQQLLGDLPSETIEVDGETREKIALPGGPPVTWTIRDDKYLIVTVGQTQVQLRAAAPPWLAELRKTSQIQRTSNLLYVNLEGSASLAKQLHPQAGAVITALGLENAKAYTSESGLNASGFVNRAHLSLDGPPRGLLASLQGEPLTKDDLNVVAADALVSATVRLDGSRLLDAAIESLGKLTPEAQAELTRNIGEMETATGVKLRQVLAGLGTAWSVQASESGGGVFSGWLVSVDIRDYGVTRDAMNQLLRLASQALAREGVTFTTHKQLGETIVTMRVADDDFPFAPSLCLTEEHLFAAAFPQPIKAALAQRSAKRTLADLPDISQTLERSPSLVARADTQKLWNLAYPFAQMGTVMFASAVQEELGLRIDLSAIPSASVGRYLRPTTVRGSWETNGIHFVQEQTLPFGELGTAGPIGAAILAPAFAAMTVQRGRVASMNNLRQIAIALHNYHDAYGALPPQATVDKQGKPLLSWRVHILPYVEQQALYDRFRLDEPWDSEHNRKLIPLLPQVYKTPAARGAPGATHYLAITGKDTVWRLPAKEHWESVKNQASAGVKFREITDGLSNTLTVVEASGKAVPWTKPDDYAYDPKDPFKGLTGLRQGGFLGFNMDGSTHFYSELMKPELLTRIFQRSDGNPAPIP